MKNHKPVSRSGRFASGPAEDVAQFTESISFDRRLWRQDIAGSQAHAKMLAAIGVLTREECRAINAGLTRSVRRSPPGSLCGKPNSRTST